MTHVQPVIFVDLDGVVADFAGHLAAHGLHDAQGRPRWDDLTHEWWAGIPVLPGAADFFARVAARAETRFLSAPSLSPSCLSGKAEWVLKFLPHEGKRAMKRLIIASGENKQLLAAPGRILIDDRRRNIDEWVEAGGIGIHFTGDFAAAERALEEALKALGIAPPRAPRSSQPPRPPQ